MDDSISISLFCASLEKDLKFKKLSVKELDKVVQFRDVAVFFTEYAKLVVASVVGQKTDIDTDSLLEVYWISTIVNPALCWSLKNVSKKKPKTYAKKVLETEFSWKDLLSRAEKGLKNTVVGQEDAVEVVIDSLYRKAAGLADPQRPVGVMLFTGPSGVGKTLIAQTLAESSDNGGFLKIDCTLFQQRHEISNLVGSPQGFIGSDNGSPLPEFLREYPNWNVILIDEVEKAHQSLHRMFMGLFDHGVIKDNKQKDAFARNSIFIMTSNAGSEESSRLMKHHLGFSEKTEIDSSSPYHRKLEEIFSPEFRGRIDDVVVFSRLDEASCRKILNLELKKVEHLLEKRGISVMVTEAARQNIVREGFSEELGARNLSSVLRKRVVKPLSRLIVQNESRKSFLVKGKNGQVKVEVK